MSVHTYYDDSDDNLRFEILGSTDKRVRMEITYAWDGSRLTLVDLDHDTARAFGTALLEASGTRVYGQLIEGALNGDDQ